jgi:K+-sensing histidine kinase KdpD
MFAPFKRLAATRGHARVGLGLTLARGLTEAMRGTLEAFPNH